MDEEWHAWRERYRKDEWARDQACALEELLFERGLDDEELALELVTAFKEALRDPDGFGNRMRRWLRSVGFRLQPEDFME